MLQHSLSSKGTKPKLLCLSTEVQQFQARYCSKKCHEEDWEQHKDFCTRRRKERKQRRKEKSQKKTKKGNRNEPSEDGLEEEDEGEKKAKQDQ